MQSKNTQQYKEPRKWDTLKGKEINRCQAQDKIPKTLKAVIITAP